jgi:hypothetical protein
MTGWPDRFASHIILNNRYLDPTLGRFVSVDPLVASTGEAYGYGGNNPVTNSDPSGLCWAWNVFCHVHELADTIVTGAENVSENGVGGLFSAEATREVQTDRDFGDPYDNEHFRPMLVYLTENALWHFAATAGAPLIDGALEIAGDGVRGLRGVFRGRPEVIPPGTLSASEIAETQQIASKYNTKIDVVGSRASGAGRGVDDPTLPVGKGPGTRSDIDFRYDTLHPNARKIQAELNEVSNGAGNASTKHSSNPAAATGRPSEPPFIQIDKRGAKFF